MTSQVTAEAASASTPATSNDSGSTPLGAIIGPAVGVPVALIFVAIIAFLLLRRRKKRRAESPTHPMGYGAEPMYKPAIPVNSPYASGKSELEGSSPNLASLSPATATYQSPSDIGGTSSTTNSPSSGLRGVSGMSQLSTARNSYQPYRPGNQQNVSELPGNPIERANPNRLSELPDKSFGHT
ncbi:MAG: hypothetical protein Q9164_005718 [Protoblastenia rupestris]